MKRTLVSILGALAMVASCQAANIGWVSFHPADDSPSANAAAAGFTFAPDVGYTQLLEANGHNVTRIVSSATPDPSVLNLFDLIIVGRSVPSSHYQNAGATAWNSITTPTIVMGGYVTRSSRLGYTTGTTIPDTAGTIGLQALVPGHPVFGGIALDGSNVMLDPFANIVDFLGTTQRGISVNMNPIAGGGTILATIATAGDPAFGGMIIGEWMPGAVMANGTADILAGHRLAFLSGSREASGLTSEGAGIYDLNPAGAQMFLNAVSYMAVPEPGVLAFLVSGLLALAWRSRRK